MTARARFTQADLKRAAAGVTLAGMTIAEIVIDRKGDIRIILGSPKSEPGNDNEWADLEQ
jgi:hypothetical protein